MIPQHISIVIPNWNGKHLLQKHLGNVIRFSPGCEIVVTDDGSIDGSMEFVRKQYPQVICVDHSVQTGFAPNVNRGVKQSSGDIIILLNTDVEPEKGWLDSLLAHFQDPKVFAVGCLEKSHEKDGIVLRGRGLSKWEKGFFVHSKGDVDKTDTAWVCGGSGAFRRSIWDKLGGMDELYAPFYWEDIDLSYRALKAGYSLVFEPKSIIHHWHEQGAIKSSYTAEDVKKIVIRNQFIFHWKNISDKKIMMAHLFWLPIRHVQALFRLDFIMIRGFGLAVGYFPKIMAERKRLKPMWKRKDQDLVVLV